MGDDVHAGDQLLDRRPVKDVALAVLGLAPAQPARVKRPSRHRSHLRHFGRLLERADERLAELTGRTGDRDRESRRDCGIPISDATGPAAAKGP